MRTLQDLEQIAKQNNWKLNPDSNIVNNILKSLNRNEEKFGKLYCPCRVKKVDENVCPCVHVRENHEIEKDGKCHCNLFVK